MNNDECMSYLCVSLFNRSLKAVTGLTLKSCFDEQT